MKPPERQPVLSFFVERFFLPEKEGCARIRKKEMIFMPPSAAKGEEAMMYIHYCKYCRRIHILNGHKLYCPACSGKLSELDISYMKYVNLSREERRALREKPAQAFCGLSQERRRQMVSGGRAGPNRPHYR